jgi:hypothetical protein
MTQDRNDTAGERPVADDLEPYRRLVELQKQMIELAQRHEQTRRRRDALHEQMVREVVGRRHHRRGWRHRLHQSAAKFLKRVPGLTPEKNGSDPFNHRQPSSC